MDTARYFLPALTLLSLAVPPASGQTFREIGTWQYVEGGGAEAIYTESTDADRTFSLAVNCEDGKPTVTLEFLLAAPGDKIGFDPERFAPDAQLEIWLDGRTVEDDAWGFSTYSETFVTDRPVRFADKLVGSETMRIQVWDTNGENVGTFRFDLTGAAQALWALSCYENGG